MRTSILGAAFLLVGASAATVAAGSNVKLNGSDTLFDVTQDVIKACKLQFADFAGNNITYLGGGSGVGAFQMQQNLQTVAPMSRALKNTEYCPTPPNVGGSPGLTEDLLVGIDGVAIVTSTINSCSGTVANGFGIGTAFTVTIDGLATSGAPTSCPGCDTLGNNTYTFADSFDALKVLYFGLTHDGTYQCAGSVRKTLVKQWKNLFTTDCASPGDTTCSAGLTHAWRRSDLSGTTDAFVSILNPAGRGIGTLPNVPAQAQKINPFCNTTDALNGTASYGGSGDFADNDPIRTVCGAGSTFDGVCGYKGIKVGQTGPGNFNGDLGLVLPILLPDGTVATQADFYPPSPVQPCTNACVLVAPIRGNQLPNGGVYTCPDGTGTVGGACFMPATASGDPRCLSANSQICAGVPGHPDGRRYNLVTVVPATQIPAAQRGTTPFQFAYDVNSVPIPTGTKPIANPRFMTGSFYRIHAFSAGPNFVAQPPSTGLCQENDDTSQIGCLVDSDQCSVGYAGREAAKLYPGGVLAANKGLSIKGVTPYTPVAVNPNADEALLNLLTTVTGPTEPFYPLSRRLYFATLYGFGNLTGGEKELAQCYAMNSIVEPLISQHGFVQIPGGVQCLDYPEESASTSSPAANSRGAGAGPILGGCNLGLTAHNACTDPLTAPDICGDGIKTPDEGCDDGNTVSGDGCSSTCTVE
jgi:cysteine-rich repeat protein